jgi:multidrug resistance protein, MATE family
VRLFREGSEAGALIRLALPIVAVQVGMMAMGVVDTLMVGRVSAVALAAVAVGNIFVFGVVALGLGTLMALDPLVAQAVGAEDQPAIARAVQRGLVLAGVLSCGLSLALLPGETLLRLLGQPEEIVPLAAAYARANIPGVFPFLAFVMLRQSLQAMGRTRPIVVTIVAANGANVLLNWALIFGHLGSPPLGAVGSGWATSICRGIMAAGLLAFAWRDLRPALRPWRREALEPGALLRMFWLGLPIGVQIQLEYGAFGLIALLMGRLGTLAVAAHQVALNLASLTFMVPLGVSAAAAVRVGQAVGRNDAAGSRAAARAALVTGVGFMTTTAALFLLAPQLLARAYTPDMVVVGLAATLIPIAGVFQVFDGLQAVAAGVLRGWGDTRSPMIVNLIGFWLIGTPVSLYLGFVAGGGPRGLWWGLVAGLAVVALALLLLVRRRLAGDLRRVLVDELAPVPATATEGVVAPALETSA